jgi:hypothetical protein
MVEDAGLVIAGVVGVVLIAAREHAADRATGATSQA